MTQLTDAELMRRWRLILGKESESHSAEDSALLTEMALSGEDQQIDRVLEALYDSDRRGGLGSSCPQVNRWLGDIRRYFPKSVVQLLQKDALERLRLHKMLLEPETLESVVPDVHLVATLLSLKSVLPEKTKETARQVVREVVEQIEQRLRTPLTSAVRGALRKIALTRRPRPNEIDWDRTIRRNLVNYLPEWKTIIPEHLIGKSRQRSSLRDLILCVDQSGSMATSVVYAGILGSVLASISSLRTRMVVFDTEVVDLTEVLNDPIELLFATQLGGGTDIHRAVRYCEQLVERPEQTTLFLVTDLYEGGDTIQLLNRVHHLIRTGVTVICLLALSDDGTPSYNHSLAEELASLGVTSFACTPDQFPDLLVAAIQKQDLQSWWNQQQPSVPITAD